MELSSWMSLDVDFNCNSKRGALMGPVPPFAATPQSTLSSSTKGL